MYYIALTIPLTVTYHFNIYSFLVLETHIQLSMSTWASLLPVSQLKMWSALTRLDFYNMHWVCMNYYNKMLYKKKKNTNSLHLIT